MRSSRLIPLLVFLSAFLLFQVQPLLSKYILPWFGGTPGVWTTCMIFFQCGLLAGYAWAHLLTRRLGRRAQAIAHALLLCAAAAALPIIPSPAWKPAGGGEPFGRILLILATAVGLPYLALSATNPLLQAWTYREDRRGSPYRLYALSNLGSFAALLSYPFAIEPFLSGRSQAWIWSAMFAAFAVGCAWTALRTGRPTSERRAERAPPPRPAPWSSARWLLQSATGTIVLLSITSYVCLEVAVVPLLWIVPLALYLLSFVAAFDRDRWYTRRRWLAALFASAAALAAALALLPPSDLLIQLLAWFAVLFCACMICHGELATSRPHPELLTTFYLTAAAGGALGGLFVGVVAPRIFDGYLELPLGLFLVLAIAALSLRAEAADGRRKRLSNALVALTLICAAVLPPAIGRSIGRGSITTVRGFFGVIRVTEDQGGDPARRKRTMLNGRVVQGSQFLSADRHALPTTYYGESSGAGLLLRSFRTERPRRIGFLGLGTGTLAVYGRKGDTIRFYEINPDVPRLARRHFTFLDDSSARVEIAVGDARTVLEREPDQNFDVLVVDVYNSASIPVHLFTVEAFQTYLRHLSPGGVIALHVTNQHLDLLPLAFALARKARLAAWHIEAKGDPSLGTLPSDYVLISQDPSLSSSVPLGQALTSPVRRIRPWTDANNNLLEVLILSEP